MPEESRCWFCHRSDAEVSAFADVETPKEREILQQMSQVTKFKADFAQSADAWRKGVPKELKEFDFKFVTSNADQFKPIRIGNGLLGEIAAPNKLLGEIGEAKKLTVDWLGNVALALREGVGEIPGFGALSPFEKADRDMLGRMVDQFEAKWRRRIGSEESRGADHSGYKQGFEGLKLFDGLEFMIAVGMLYYDVQAQLLDMARRKEINSKPKRGVSDMLVTGYPPVPICSVCADVMKELSPRQLAVEPELRQQVAAVPPHKIVHVA
ncbi:MAG TPA: hypothetical protein VLU91_00360 [Nitrososphaerales archaeon]|nr:hypothetical protein [Nitrososphaerales archaeon]